MNKLFKCIKHSKKNTGFLRQQIKIFEIYKNADKSKYILNYCTAANKIFKLLKAKTNFISQQCFYFKNIY